MNCPTPISLQTATAADDTTADIAAGRFFSPSAILSQQPTVPEDHACVHNRLTTVFVSR